jgi:hypothetical protein
VLCVDKICKLSGLEERVQKKTNVEGEG